MQDSVLEALIALGLYPKAPAGTSGDRAGHIYQFTQLTGTGDTNPGFFKIDNADPALATKIRLDSVDYRGINMGPTFLSWTVNSIINIYSNTPTGTGYLKFKLASVPVLEAPGGRYVADITAGTGIIFAEGESCAIQYSAAGTPGGPAGDKGGIRYNVDLANTDLTTVTAGNIKFNNGTISSVTAISIHKTSADAQNMAAFLATLQLGGTAKLMSNAAGGGVPFFIFDLTATPVISTNYVTLTGAYIAGSAFSANEEVVFDYTPGTEAPTYTSLSDATLPVAASNPNLIIQLQKALAAHNFGRRALYASDGAAFIGLGRVTVDSFGGDIAFTPSPSGTWTVSNNAGKVRLTRTAHGLTVAVGTKLYIKTTANGWTIGQQVGITAIPTADAIDTDVDYNVTTPQTTPTFALIGERMIVAVPIPILLPNSRIDVDSTWIAAGAGVGNKTISIELSVTEFGTGTGLWTPPATTTNSMTRTPVGIVNKNSVTTQRSRYGANNLIGMNVTASGSMATSNIDTSAVTFLQFVSVVANLNEVSILAQRHVEVIY